MRKGIIRKKTNFVYQDSIFVKFYECQHCGYIHVIDEDKYCSNCGVKIEWIN